MNKPLALADLITSIPVMTKREKLMRLAKLVRLAPHNLAMFNGIEYATAADLGQLHHPLSAFAVASTDPIFKDAGLQGDRVGEAMRFFELTKNELHAFSCDCGGHIDNQQMARRVEALAAST